jgi:hypothetical protein
MSDNKVSFVDIPAMGWGLSGALVAAFVLCAIAGMILPELPLAHAWLGLFTTAPLGSARSFAEGIVGSVAFGWILGFVFAWIYNRVAARA